MKLLHIIILILIVSRMDFGISQTVVPKEENNAIPQKNISNSKEETIREESLEEKKLEAPVSKKAKSSAYRTDVESKDQNLKVKEQQATQFSNLKKNVQYKRIQKNPTPEEQKQLNEVVDYYGTNFPNSFEYHYFKFAASSYDLKEMGHLLEAEKLKPNNVDVHKMLVACYYLKNDTIALKKHLKILKESNVIQADLIDYASDMLTSSTKNAFLFTHGFDDSYAILYQQQINGYRKDVQLVSLDFLQSESQKLILKTKGLKLPESLVVDTAYFKKLLEMNPQNNWNISLTIPKEYLLGVKNQLYVHGLVFVYSNLKMENNFFMNDYLWHEQLNKKVIYSYQSDKAKLLSSNYLPMCLLMKKVYVQKGDVDQIQQLDDTINRISIQSQKKKEVNALNHKN